jgi:thioredoxin 1
MASENLKEITDDTFQAEALESTAPVVVDFWAPWCGPCKMLTPIVEELAEEYDGTVVFAKVNVDESPRVASKYGVTSIPTLLFIKNGSVADQHVGLLAKGPLKAKVDELVAS